MFWPECDQRHARGNLRSSLFEITHALGEASLSAYQDLVELDGTALRVDILDLLLAVGPEAGKGGTIPSDRLRDAVRAWAGGFMAGFSLEGCADFDDWQFQWTEKAREAYCRALHFLAEEARAKGRCFLAEEMALRWVEASPLDEGARSHLIAVLLDLGQAEAACLQYASWERTAREELGREPSQALRELGARLRFRTSPQGARSSRPEPAPGRLFGRDGELSALESRLGAREGKRITLCGPGGVGKTALARRLLDRVADSFPGGAWFVDLSAERDADRIVFEIGATLGLRTQAESPAAMEKGLVARLGSGSCLLVLDNLEQLEGAAAVLERISGACPGLSLLATSRSPLGLPSEECIALEALRFPLPGLAEGCLEVEDWPALELFLSLVRSAGLPFPLDRKDLWTCAGICGRMDGLPLALELVAPLAALLGPSETLARLEDRLDAVALPVSDRPFRHRDLLAVVDWSYELLAPSGKRLFAGLALFEDSFDLESVEALFAEEWAARESGRSGGGGLVAEFRSLVAKSLVRHASGGERARFSFLFTIRDHALRKLAELEDRAELEKRLALHFLERAERAAGSLQGARQIEVIHDLARDERNFEASIGRLIAGGMLDEALRLCRALDWYWFRTGRHAEAIRMLESALKRNGDPAKASEPGLRGACLRALAWLRFTLGDWHEAHALYLEAMSLLEASGDRKELVRCLSDLGVVERWLGNRAGGDTRSLAALALAEEEGDPSLMARALVWHHGTRGGRPGSEEQKEGLERAIRLARNAGLPWILAHAQGSLAELLRERGDFEAALPQFERALECFRIMEDGWMLAWTLEGYGDLECENGCAETGIERLRQAFDLFFRLGAQGDALYVLGRLGLVAARLGRREEADFLLGCFSGLRGELGLETVAMSFEPEPRPATKPGLRDFLEQARALDSPDWRKGLRASFGEAKEYILARPCCNDPATPSS